MRVVVVKDYIDKYTRESHKVGEILNMEERRYFEIQGEGLYLVDITGEIGQCDSAPASVNCEKSSDENELGEPEKADIKGRRTRKKNESEG